MRNEFSTIQKRRTVSTKRKKNKLKWIVMSIFIIVISILLLIFLGQFVFLSLKQETPTDQPISSLHINEQAEFESAIIEGVIPGFNDDKVNPSTNMFAFKINTKPKVDASNNANLLLENNRENCYLMAVEITLDDSDIVIYRSRYVKPAQYINSIVLEEKLSVGEHPATAYIGAIDPQTLELLTSFEQPIVFIVKE